MGSFTILTVTIILIIVSGILIQVFLYRDREKQKKLYPILWKEFEANVTFNAYADILKTGNELVFNKYLSQEHLTIIYELAIELEKRFPEFKSLRLNAYNKQLHYNRPIPSPWSSGGIKQTWTK